MSQPDLLWLPGTWPSPNKLWDTLKAKIYHKQSKREKPFSVSNPDHYKVIYLFRILRCFQHYTGHIMTGSWKGRGNQYIQSVRILYCKLPTNGKQLPAFPLETVPENEPRPQRWKARVLPLCHQGPSPL